MVNQEQVPEMKRENNTNKHSSSSLLPEKRRCPSPDSLQVRAFSKSQYFSDLKLYQHSKKIPLVFY